MMLRLVKLKPKFGVFVICASLLSLTGCASNRLTTSELLNHQTNCEHVEQELAFLEQNAPNRIDQIWAGVQIMTLGIFTPDRDRKAQVANGSSAYWVQSIKEDYYRKCLKL
jgi:hypothetical protein